MNQAFASQEASGRGSETKERILDAAEQLFATDGFAATSLRSITAQARVNLAAVNYHFQSKESLLLAVLMRKLEPVNRRRLAMLDAVESAHGGDAPPLEDILRAFLVPVVEARAGGVELCSFAKLLGRIITEPGDLMIRVFETAFAPVAARFGPALQRAIPGMTQCEVGWGMHFSIGAMAHYLAAGPLLAVTSRGQADPNDTAGAVERMVAYMAGGLRAMNKETGR